MQVSQLYAALFGRAADPEGLQYWADQIDSGTPVTDVVRAMLHTAPAAYFYPDLTNNAAVINSFYQNVLGRAPDQGGFDYWNGRLNGGEPVENVLAEIVDVVVNYDGTDTDGLKSQALFNKRVDVANKFLDSLNAVGSYGG